jgi:phage portal protein BeeE
MDFRDLDTTDVTDTVETSKDHFEVPPPAAATADDVERFNREYLRQNGIEAARSGRPTDPEEAPFAKQDGEAPLGEDVKHRAEFPWLYDPSRGVRWDFDPISLRNLAQPNTWVGMLVGSITKEIAETPWTIVRADDATETQKRLSTHPEERSPVAKELPDATAERIHSILMDPNPDHTWQDMVEMWYADLLEIGSMASTKAFPRSAYDGDEFVADPATVEPRALMPTPPEVWTKDYHDKSGITNGFWQFENHSAPGAGNTDGSRTGSRGLHDPTFFDTAEVLWTDHSPRTNRRYGLPPTLTVRDFLQSTDLAVTQEQQYLSRGSIPSGAWVFEQWDREEVIEKKEEMEENVKGKPHKSLMFAGKKGDVRFEPMSMNFQELEFTERMKWYARVIASAFQVPTAVVGIEPERVNYNTFQGERENFESNTLGPYLQKGERWLTYNFIQPHWGDDYRFEFKPGMSESTRGMISERTRSEFNANLRTRNEARREIGLDPVDDAEEGFKEDVTEESDAGGPFGDIGGLEQAFKATGSAVEFPNAGGPAFETRLTLIDFCDDLAEVCDGGVFVGDDQYPDDVTGDGDGQPVRAVGINERKAYAVWSRYRDEAVALSDPHAVDSASDVVEQSEGGDSGNPNESVRKDEPLRGTDEWYLFDVQPAEVERLQEAIADDVAALYDEVLSDAAIQDAIERLAASEGEETTDDTDETAKSLSAVSRRLRELLSELDIAGDIASAIQGQTADEIAEAVGDALADADDAPADDVDVQAIRERLSDRNVSFANEFADRMAEDIRETVGDGWAEGKNSREIAQDIAEQGEITEGWTGAERIARQELQIAAGEARSEVAAELDKVEVWNDSGDDRVRDAHAEMDGLWKWPGEEWQVEYPDRGVQKESVPGSSEPGIGCRCQTLLRDRDEVDSDDHAGA